MEGAAEFERGSDSMAVVAAVAAAAETIWALGADVDGESWGMGVESGRAKWGTGLNNRGKKIFMKTGNTRRSTRSFQDYEDL